MKAISIQQPWTYCITHGTKRVENRRWPTNHRGLTLLHAGKKYYAPGIEIEIHRDSPEMDIAGMLAAPRGAIVGCAYLSDCIERNEALAVDQLIWADPYQWKFFFTDVVAFAKPLPWKGWLGIFDVPDYVVEGLVP